MPPWCPITQSAAVKKQAERNAVQIASNRLNRSLTKDEERIAITVFNNTLNQAEGIKKDIDSCFLENR